MRTGTRAGDAGGGIAPRNEHLAYRVLPKEPSGTVRISIAGCIDERADFEPIRARAGTGDLVLDLAAIDAMNSAGISRWILFLEQLTRAAPRRVTLARCSFHGFVMPAALITNMTAGAHVESVHVPYACACSEVFVLVSSWADLETVQECGRCRCTRTLDVPPELLEPLLGPRAASDRRDDDPETSAARR